MEVVKGIIRHQMLEWCPPILTRCIRRTRDFLGTTRGSRLTDEIQFVGDFESWDEAAKATVGYSSKLIAEKVKGAAMKVKRGEAAYEQDSVLFSTLTYPWPLLANLLLAAANCDGRLRILDFGGSLGSTFFRCQRYLQELSEINWAIVEQPQFVSLGRDLEGGGLRFFDSVQDAWKTTQPQVLLLGGVLQYLESPHKELEALLEYPWNFVLFDRTAMLPNRESDRLTIQTVPATIYQASYPAWFFSKDRFVAAFHRDFDLISSWVNCERFVLDRDQTSFEGFCFKRRPAQAARDD